MRRTLCPCGGMAMPLPGSSSQRRAAHSVPEATHTHTPLARRGPLLLQAAGLLQDAGQVTYVEYGAGKGYLRWACACWHVLLPHACLRPGLRAAAAGRPAGPHSPICGHPHLVVECQHVPRCPAPAAPPSASQRDAERVHRCEQAGGDGRARLQAQGGQVGRVCASVDAAPERGCALTCRLGREGSNAHVTRRERGTGRAGLAPHRVPGAESQPGRCGPGTGRLGTPRCKPMPRASPRLPAPVCPRAPTLPFAHTHRTWISPTPPAGACGT